MALPTEPNGIKPRRSPLRIALAFIVPVAITWFIARSIVANWPAIRAHDWAFDPAWVLLATALYLFVIVFLVELWARLLWVVSGRPIGLGRAYRVSALANLGKYLPGKVWTVMGVIFLLKKDGYPGPATFASTILHQAFTIVAGAMFTLLTLGAEFWSGQPLLPIVLGFGVTLAILYPPFFNWCLNRGLRLLRREPVIVRLSLTRSLVLFAFYLIAWGIYGSSFWCFLRGVGLDNLPFWEISAASCAAYLLGFLALFAPGGLGVREGVLAVMLAPYMGAGLPAAVAVLSRLWMTIAELLGLLPLLTPLGSRTTDTRDRAAQ